MRPRGLFVDEADTQFGSLGAGATRNERRVAPGKIQAR